MQAILTNLENFNAKTKIINTNLALIVSFYIHLPLQKRKAPNECVSTFKL